MTPEYAEALYRKEVGEPKRLPPDHPYAWQWDYRGTKEERGRLAEELFGLPTEYEQQELEAA